MVGSIMPNTNLINVQDNAQKFMYGNQSPSPYTADIYKDFYFNKPTALPPKGGLVKGSLLPKDIFGSYVTAAKTFRRALKGEGGDYEIGKLNDSAIRLGSLSFAAVLSSRAPTPFLKAMEFVGFSTWFVAMSIWPKYCIGKPVEMLTGVNINQKYIDSYGREKRFFDDPQYLPWDIMSAETINKAGKKLGIPENIENRREVIQDRMRQVAVQANTLWMLTAGFSTPILSSLIADKLRYPVKTLMDNARTMIATARLESFTDGLDSVTRQGNLLDKAVNIISNPKKIFNTVVRTIADLGSPPLSVTEQGAKELIQHRRALEGYFKATLVDGIGNSWMDFSKDILGTLKMPSKSVEQLARCAEGPERTRFIVDYIGTLDQERLKIIIGKLKEKVRIPVAAADDAKTFILNHTNMSDPITQSFIKDVDVRLANIKSSFLRVGNILKDGGKVTANVQALFDGIKPSDAFVEIVKTAKSKGTDALRQCLDFIPLEVERGDIQKAILAEAKQAGNGEYIIPKLSKYIAQAPQDLLAGAAKETSAYKGWLKIVGIAGIALLGITLFAISRMGKPNQYNPVNYKYKEGSGNERSK